MAERNDTSGTPPEPNPHPLQQELAELDNQLYRLLCVVQVYHEALQALIAEDAEGADVRRQFGLSCVHDWIEGMGLAALKQLERAATTAKQRAL